MNISIKIGHLIIVAPLEFKSFNKNSATFIKVVGKIDAEVSLQNEKVGFPK